MIGILWTFWLYPSGKLLSDMGEPDPGTSSEVAKGSSVFDQVDLRKTMSSFCTCHMSSQIVFALVYLLPIPKGLSDKCLAFPYLFFK